MSHGQGWSQTRYVARVIRVFPLPSIEIDNYARYTWLTVLVVLGMKPWSLYMPGYIELHGRPSKLFQSE